MGKNDAKSVLDEARLQRVTSYLNLWDVGASKFFKWLVGAGISAEMRGKENGFWFGCLRKREDMLGYQG